MYVGSLNGVHRKEPILVIIHARVCAHVIGCVICKLGG